MKSTTKETLRQELIRKADEMGRFDLFYYFQTCNYLGLLWNLYAVRFNY